MKRTLLLAALLGLLASPGALAQGNDGGWGHQFSPGQARDAVREGKTVSLNKIFQSLKREYGGYQLAAELYAREDGGAQYEIDWMTDSGRKMRFVVDASSGAILDRQGA